jgi:L,D-transpeptidase catalytic domain
MKKDSLEYSSLVAHGWGSQKGDDDELEFSNIPNSCQTSLGKYRIGYSYNGSFGQAYKLYGLDNTNSRAFERAIVLHSLSHFPESETWPERIPQSAGCPMVSRSFLDVLGEYIKPSKKPVLLWIYN